MDKQTIRRAGIIPCSQVGNTQCYLLGIDNKSNDYSDWGGRIERSDNSPYHAASRELYEESLGCINFHPERLKKEGIPLQHNGVLIILVRVSFEELLDYITAFEARYKEAEKTTQRLEMKGTRLLIGNELYKCLERNKLYSVVASVLTKNSSLLHRQLAQS